ncbi:MAG: LD-carboxypeptidase [Firmicutes bacterium]|nr:LD-carboxypeptidase [Bacillota bacterium]
MIYPKKLEKGGTVGIICPSSPITKERQIQCVKTLENMGYRVKAADNLTSNQGGFMAGTGKERGEWINKMFADPEVDAIFCVRGGDGGTRAYEYIDLDIVRANPKIFVGYSDITTMHLLFNQQADLVTFHGPMVSSNMVDGFDQETEKAFFDAINGDHTYEFKNPEGIPLEVLKEGKATGQVVGGNLSLLSAAMGTPYEMDAKGKIIFMEEVDEPVTKIEKWAYQLRNAGKFHECAGILLGQFTDITNKNMPEYREIQCFRDILDGIDVPVMYHVESGHGDKIITLPFGANCTMDTEKKTIVFDIQR